MEVYFLMGDIFLVVFVVGVPIGFIIWSKGKTRISWLICFAGMFAWLGASEWFWRCIDSDKLTLSQRFYALPQLEAWLIASTLLIAWLGLLAHLLYGNWRKNRG